MSVLKRIKRRASFIDRKAMKYHRGGGLVIGFAQLYFLVLVLTRLLRPAAGIIRFQRIPHHSPVRK